MSDFMTARRTQYNPELETALRILEAEAANFARIFIQDSNVRFNYMKQTRAMSAEIRASYDAGRIIAFEGARRANHLRNVIMEAGRLKSSSIGNARAVKLKKQGATLSELLEYYAHKEFNTSFTKLNTNQQNKVYLKIIEAAGRSRPKVNAEALMMSRLGKAFTVLTIGIAVYNVTTAENKTEAAMREGATIGGGILGGAIGGAIASSAAAGAATGLVCGPGAPICSTVGVFVGGALGALGASFAFNWLSK